MKKMADYAALIRPTCHVLFAFTKFGVAIIISGSPANIGPAALIIGIAGPLAIDACSAIVAR
jgi:hypothetical protein